MYWGYHFTLAVLLEPSPLYHTIKQITHFMCVTCHTTSHITHRSVCPTEVATRTAQTTTPLACVLPPTWVYCCLLPGPRGTLYRWRTGLSLKRTWVGVICDVLYVQSLLRVLCFCNGVSYRYLLGGVQA